jgi:hypothetical protein
MTNVGRETMSSKVSKGSSTNKLALNLENGTLIQKVTAIERPKDLIQCYVLNGLRTRPHFSCPTILLPSLIKEVERIQGVPVDEILFVPSSCERCVSESLIVLNNCKWCDSTSIPIKDLLEDVKEHSNDKSSSSSPLSSKKRSRQSISIGLQTIYSYQQYEARYSMLPHSKPHVVKVKSYPPRLCENILSIYESLQRTIQKRKVDLKPESCSNSNANDVVSDDNKKKEFIQRSLRNDMLQHIMGRKNDTEKLNKHDIPLEIMFESCTLQRTGGLALHCDTLNCPSNDQTFAALIPAGNQMDCLTALYYSRKSVTDHVSKMTTIHKIIGDSSQCPLLRLTLKCVLSKNNVFDYQGMLYENKDSLDNIGKSLRNNSANSCDMVESFTGLKCFKHGAAFDKMGYYSVFMHVFLSMHYMELIVNKDDALSFSMYFGLLCNGTSALAAVWNEVVKRKNDVKKFLYEKKGQRSKLFKLLVRIDKSLRTNGDKASVGSCKLPRFQYPNYATDIIDNHKEITVTLSSFLSKCSLQSSSENVFKMHNELYNMLRNQKLKGIGPMTFNQLWHSLCLCGLLPVSFINFSMISVTAGPAKLIQTFYPNRKTQKELNNTMHSLKSQFFDLGFKKVTDFFLENMLCEIWRLAGKRHCGDGKMKLCSLSEKKEYFFSKKFYDSMRIAMPTRHPDIYFQDPVKGHYQHLFRVVDNELLMRPSNVMQNGKSSASVVCEIAYDTATETQECKVHVSWKGDLVRLHHTSPRSWFADDTTNVSSVVCLDSD